MRQKKTIAVMMAACMLALTACGGSSTENFADNARSSIAASTPAAAASTPAAEVSTPAAEASTPSTGVSADTADMEGVMGKKTANMYLNEYFNISLEMPDANWVILNDEQLSQQLQIVQAVMDDNGVKNLMDQGGVYYDLYAIDQQTNDNINITLQKIPFGGQGAEAALDSMEENLLNMMGAQLVATYEQMGLQGATYEVGTVNFCGEEKKALFAEVAILKQCVVILVEGEYFAAISTTSGSGQHQALMESFMKVQ